MTENEYPIVRQENRIEQKAARLGWHIPQDKKQDIVDAQIEIATGVATNREKTSAARVLASMNGQNVAIAISHIEEDEERIETVTTEDILIAMRRATSAPPPQPNDGSSSDTTPTTTQ